MTDDDKKKETLCIFITPSERLGVDENGKNFYRDCSLGAKKYFEKFYNHAVLPLEDDDGPIDKHCIDAINDSNVKNVQVIFDIHGDEEGLSISETEMHKILLPIITSLEGKKIEIIMANCQGNLKFKENNDYVSLPEYLKYMVELFDVKNISLYCMPKGHGATIKFNKNGDIFFVSNDALYTSDKHKDNTTVTRFYTKEDQEEDKPDTCMTFNNDAEIQVEEPFDEKGNKIQPLVQGVYKGRPPIQIDISTGKPFPTAIVPYKQPNASMLKQILKTHQKKNVTKINTKKNLPKNKITLSKNKIIHKITRKKIDLNLNKKNEINTTIKK